MAGSVRLLIPLCLAGLVTSAWSQTATPPPAASPGEKLKKQPGAWLGAGPKTPFDGTPSPEFDNVSRALNALNPEQRKRFQENFRRWSNLSPAEKKALGDREDVRKRVMQREVDAAIKESGLELDGEQRETFAKRYADERRKIEEQLRKETNEKRKPLVRDLIGRLKGEFSTTPTVAATPAPSAPLAPSGASSVR